MRILEVIAVFLGFMLLFGLCLSALSSALVAFSIPAALVATVVVYRV